MKKASMKSGKIDVLLYFFTKALSGILSFVLVSLYTFLLKPGVYGNYSLIYGVVNVAISILMGWISSSCLRYYSDYKNNKNSFYTNVVIDWLLMILLSFIIIITISLFSINIPIKPFLTYVLLLLVFNSIYEIFNSILRANKSTFIYLCVIVGQYLITIPSFIIMLKVFHMDLNGIFISLILSYFVMSTFLVFHFKIYKYINLKYYSGTIQKRFLKYGIPMIGVWATSWILNYSDRYLIKIFCSSSEVGLYDIGYKLAENSINILITSLSMAMMPILIDKYNNDGEKAAEDIHYKFLKYYFILVIPSVLGLIAIKDDIYGILINKQYIDGSMTIVFISLSMLFFGFNQMIYKLLQLKEKTNRILVFTIISVILNIILNVILIPKYGFIMAAITTLISNVISTLIAYIDISKYFAIRIDFKSLIKVLISGTVMFLAVSNIKSSNLFELCIIVLISIVIYFGLLLLLGEFKDELKKIKNIRKKEL